MQRRVRPQLGVMPLHSWWHERCTAACDMVRRPKRASYPARTWVSAWALQEFCKWHGR